MAPARGPSAMAAARGPWLREEEGDGRKKAGQLLVSAGSVGGEGLGD